MSNPEDDLAYDPGRYAPFTITPIGRVENSEHDPARWDWAQVRSRIRLGPGPGGGVALHGLDGYSHVIVLGWLDRTPDELRVRARAYPQGDRSLPQQGAFALRGPRPNPISVTVCRLLGIDGDSIEVAGLDLIAGTPILDVKPYIAFYDAPPDATIPRWAGGP